MDRAQRARRRHGDDGGRPADDAENPLPAAIDPITLEPVVTPAISPFGHVMGLATWNAVLAEQGKCPFTQQPLRRDQVRHSSPVLSLLYVKCFCLSVKGLCVCDVLCVAAKENTQHLKRSVCKGRHTSTM